MAFGSILVDIAAVNEGGRVVAEVGDADRREPVSVRLARDVVGTPGPKGALGT